MGLSFRHLVSAKDLQRQDVEAILKEAEEMEKVLKTGGDERLKGKILAALFYEPSTRTRLSFEAAMHHLGGSVITANGIENSSLKKGESIEDTMRMVSQYADIIAMRHPEQGSAAIAATAAAVPFINAGDGGNQHPTQGLLDVFTIHRELGTHENLTVAIAGDLLYGRTIHATASVLALFPQRECIFISPPALRMPQDVKDFLKEHGVSFRETEALAEGLEADVLYMTRIQSERFSDVTEYERYKNLYQLSARDLQARKTVIMHALPRNTEIATDVDGLPNAAYFRQAGNAVPVRMALLSMMVGKM